MTPALNLAATSGAGAIGRSAAGGLAASGLAAGRFAAGRFAAGRFAAGRFAAGRFAAGRFAAGSFAAGSFAAGSFAAGGPGAAKTANSLPAKARAAAQDFEAVYLNSMFSQMFTSIDGEGPFGGAGSAGVWRSFLTEEYAKSFARSGGIGIADHVYRSLIAQQEATLK